MNFTGNEHFDCNQAELWARLTNMEFVSRVIPDIDRVVSINSTEFTCKVRPRFSFLSGSLELSFALVEAAAPDRLTVRSQGKGIGAAVVVEAELQLSAAEQGTNLRWSGTIISREGLLKPISASLIQAAAERVIQNFWQKFREGLTG